MSATLLELRIYAGLHAGARVGISSLEETLLLGSVPDNDVILRDAPFTSETLRLSESGWHWPGANAEQAIAWGHAVQMDGLVFTVDEHGAPWPADQSWVIAWSQQATVAPVQAPDTEAPIPIEPEPQERLAEGADAELVTLPDTVSVAQRKRYRWGALAGVALLLLLGVWWWSIRSLSGAESVTGGGLHVEGHMRPAAPDSVSLPALQRALQLAGYAQQVRVVALSQDKFQLIGVVANEAELDNVLRAASTVTRKIVPSVLIQSEFAARLRTLIPQLPEAITAKPLPVGVVGLHSLADQDDSLAQAKQLIGQELPELVAFHIEKVEAVAVEASPRDTSAQALQLRIKKKIAAIQSGPNSYVLLASGQKVMPGGGLENHRLLQIEDQSLLLQDASGNTIRVLR
jgi:hypothetical protein